MDLWSSLTEWVAKPRVVHRLPGRLRVHLPFLKGACAARSPVVGLVQRLLAVPDEIRSVKVSPQTGNAVIEYDRTAVSEADVLAYLNQALRLCIRNRNRLSGAGSARVLELTDELEAVVRSAIRHKLTLDASVEIPDELLA